MKRIFICHSYYHLLISYLFSQYYSFQNNIVIFCDDNKKFYREIKNFEIIKIDESKEFKDKLLSIRTYCYLPKFLKLFFRKKFIRKLDNISQLKFKKTFDEVYIFNDSSYLLLEILNWDVKKYIYIEDGLRTYDKYNFLLFNKVLYQIFKLPSLFRDGRSSIFSRIYCSRINELDKIQKNKAISFDLNFLLENVNITPFENLLGLRGLPRNFVYNSVLLITQPLYKDGILKSESDKISLYSDAR